MVVFINGLLKIMSLQRLSICTLFSRSDKLFGEYSAKIPYFLPFGTFFLGHCGTVLLFQNFLLGKCSVCPAISKPTSVHVPLYDQKPIFSLYMVQSAVNQA
jgi:hypothetical protein